MRRALGICAVLCLAAWAVGARRSSPEDHDWEAEFEAAEAERRAALVALVAQPASYTKSMSSSTAPTSDGSRSL